MIEATCSACGTQNRIADSDVPPGALFVTCTSCKARVPVPGAAAKKLGIPSIPKVSGQIPTIPKPGAPAAPPKPPVGPPPVKAGIPPIKPAAAPPPPVPVPPPAEAGRNEVIDLSDLPAPRRASPLAGTQAEPKAAPKSGLQAAFEADLPAPKTRTAPAGPLDLDDLMGSGPADLPAPKARTQAPSTPPRGLDVDLPAPKAAPRGLDVDLPAPKGPSAGFDADLPAPKSARPSGRSQPPPAAFDLELDLPAPKGPADLSDLPAPKPGGGGGDLPAPKGFFDDLPQPAKGARGEAPGDVAPKGFFDDLPQPAKPSAPGDALAPKGFFDDLPQPAAKPAARGGLELPPDAQNFFDDLSPPSAPSAPAQPARAKAPSGGIDLGDDPIEPLDLADEPAGLELAEPSDDIPQPRAKPVSASPPSSSGSFDDLDLSAPSAAPGAVAQRASTQRPLDEEGRSAIKFSSTPSTAKPAERATLPSLGTKSNTDDGALELEEPREKHEVSQKLGPKPDRKSQAQKPIKKPVNKKLALGIVLGLAAAGAGGFVFYQRHTAAQARKAEIDDGLQAARAALASPAADRWTKANNAAARVLEIDPQNGAAAGIAAEAMIAGAYSDGQRMAQRIQAGKKRISDALASGVTPELERAQAVAAISSNPQAAVDKLSGLIAKYSNDPNLSLYLGWAHAANGNLAEAIKAYDSSASSPATKNLALLGRARAKLLLADSEGARADFAAILADDKESIPAQVGLAASLPAGQTQQQESDLLALLSLPKERLEKTDPRSVTLAWTLAGDAARTAGRLDVARERYRKARELDENDIGALTSLAALEIAEGKLDAAQELVDKALTANKTYAPALLVSAELAIAGKKLDAAGTILDELEARTPPLPTLQLVRVGIVRGKLAEAREDHEGAVAAYTAAAKLAGELDLTPTMLAISKLTDMARTATDAAKQADYKRQADVLLSALASAAENDPSLAYALGVAYLQTGEAAQAEPWLRKVLTLRGGKDPDATYQLAKALRILGRASESIDQLEKAVDLAPDRTDIAVELAQSYEALKNDDAAGKLYDALLAKPNPTIEMRSYAGLFYLRTNQAAKAGEQGKALVEADDENATGHYLIGEGALAANNLDEAKREFNRAVQRERNARHLDAQGRTYEAIFRARNDVAALDSAINTFKAALELDPKIFTSQLGYGRLKLVQGGTDAQKIGVTALLAANELKKNHWEVAFELGKAYAKQGETKVAVAWLKLSEDAKSTADVAYQLAQVYTSPGVDDGRAAEAAYKRAVARADDANKKDGTTYPEWYSDALFAWGSLAETNNNLSDAKRAFERFLASSPRSKAKITEANRKLATSLRGVP